MSVELFLNSSAWVLTAAMQPTDTTIAVSPSGGNGGALPPDGYVYSSRFKIGSEIVILTGTTGSGASWTVTRAAEGTALPSSAYAVGTPLVAVPTAGALTNLGSILNQGGTYPQLQPAGIFGRMFRSVENPVTYVDLASGYTLDYPVLKLNPPPTTGWTATNVAPTGSNGSSPGTVVDFSTGFPQIYAANGGNNSENVSVLSRPLAAPYSVAGLIQPITPPINGNRTVGLCFFDSAALKVSSLCYDFNSGTAHLAGYCWTNPTTYGYQNLGGNFNNAVDLAVTRFLRLRNDGTTLSYDASPDGTVWMNLWTAGVGSFLTPDSVGFFTNASQAGVPIGCKLLHWNVTTTTTL